MRTAFLQLHTAIFLAGFTGILGRLITLNEGLLVWYRLMITSIVLWLIFFFSKRRKILISNSELWKLFGVGGIVALHWVFFYGSIKYANVSIALVCFSSVGFFTAIFEPLLIQRKTDAVELILGIVVIAGIYLIFHFDPQFKTGIVLGIISSILAAWFTILNKKLVAVHDSHTITLFELSGGWIVWSLILPIYLYNFPSEKLVPGLSDLGWLFVLSVLCTVLAFNLAIRALQKISSFTVNLSYNLEPLYGILLAFVVYKENEHLDQGFFLGLGLIMLAVVLQSLRIMKKPRLVDSAG
jgi:drug/metabolite transporter (DMT)-like permease